MRQKPLHPASDAIAREVGLEASSRDTVRCPDGVEHLRCFCGDGRFA